MKIVKSADEAVAEIQSNQRLFIHGGAATPHALIDGLLTRAPQLHNVELVHLHTMGAAPWANPQYTKHFRVSPFFIGENMRDPYRKGHVDYIPCFLSEIPSLFRSGRFPVHAALIHVSPPDRHGFCTLGTSVDIARAAVDTAKLVIAQINSNMPRIHGDGLLHTSQIDFAIEIDTPLPQPPDVPTNAVELGVGRNVASLIDDGATLQMGIGSIPNAVLASLKGHRRLGVHTEMWSDGALELIQSGVIDNSMKKTHPGKTVSSFIFGSKAVYDFIHDNPSVAQLDVGYVNNPVNIARNPKVAAINSAVEIDLTGQICADSVGSRIISGVGGQMDFIRGASLSAGGKPIIAVTSRSPQGFSRIVPTLKQGAGVVTTRAHVHWVVTEHGVADLYGKNLSERAKALIAIAHTDDRENLERAWFDRLRG